jgi:hypothetical protein
MFWVAIVNCKTGRFTIQFTIKKYFENIFEIGIESHHDYYYYIDVKTLPLGVKSK